MTAMIKRFRAWLKEWLTRPMTQSEYDTMMARLGIIRKKCRYCGGENPLSTSGNGSTGPR